MDIYSALWVLMVISYGAEYAPMCFQLFMG